MSRFDKTVRGEAGPGGTAARRLAAQLAIAETLVVGRTLQEVAPRVLDTLCAGEDWVVAGLWHRAGAALVCAGMWHAPGFAAGSFVNDSLSWPMSLGQGIPGRVGESGRPWWITDLLREPGVARVRQAAEAGLQGGCAVPIAAGHEVAGVLEVFWLPELPRDRGVVEHLATVAAHLGLFLRRVEREHQHEAAEAQLREALAREVEQRRLVSLGTLAAGVGHEINNPLTYVRLNLSRLISLERAGGLGTPESLHRLELLQDVREGVDRVATIVRDLRVFASTSKDKAGAVDLETAMDAALRLADHEIRHRAPVVRTMGGVPPVRGEAGVLGQVLLNLLVNAAQAIPEGEAGDHEISVSTATDDAGRAIVDIQDTGVGIPPEALPHIFEPFFTTKGTAGSGLGLFLAKRIVDELGGELAVEPRPGRGTRVTLRLPVAGRAEATALAGRAAGGRTRAKGRVLIVDDERAVAAALAAMIGDYHEVRVAGSGHEAIEIFRRDRDFDVVLCDLAMSHGTGLDVHDWLVARAPALADRVVFMTGGVTSAHTQAFLDRVPNACIEKPVDEEAVLELIHRWVARRRDPAHCDTPPLGVPVTPPPRDPASA